MFLDPGFVLGGHVGGRHEAPGGAEEEGLDDLCPRGHAQLLV